MNPYCTWWQWYMGMPLAPCYFPWVSFHVWPWWWSDKAQGRRGERRRAQSRRQPEQPEAPR